jgi:hypothetical protein
MLFHAAIGADFAGAIGAVEAARSGVSTGASWLRIHPSREAAPNQESDRQTAVEADAGFCVSTPPW